MKKQYSISVEKDLMDKLDCYAKFYGISRNAAISVVIARFAKERVTDELVEAYKMDRKKIVEPHNVFTCLCATCEKERDDGERAGDEERESN